MHLELPNPQRLDLNLSWERKRFIDLCDIAKPTVFFSFGGGGKDELSQFSPALNTGKRLLVGHSEILCYISNCKIASLKCSFSSLQRSSMSYSLSVTKYLRNISD